MGRIYSTTIDGVAVTAQQDLFAIVASSAATLLVHGVVLGQTSDVGDAAEELLSIVFKSGATTVGSGGASVTPVPNILGDTAFAGTARRNDTTIASGGTIVTRHSDVWNVRTQFVWLPPPELRPRIAPSARFVVGLASTPADSLTVNGTIYFESV